MCFRVGCWVQEECWCEHGGERGTQGVFFTQAELGLYGGWADCMRILPHQVKQQRQECGRDTCAKCTCLTGTFLWFCVQEW